MANEKRLTDANELLHKFCVKCDAIYSEEPCEPSECIFYEMVKNAPIVDAVEVVRCKDCVSFEEKFRTVGDATRKVYCGGYCYHWDYELGMSPNQVDGDDFCSYGERRTED